MGRARKQSGQASAELVAVVPLVLVVLLAVSQLAIAGYALWSAGAAARAGARAAYVGGDAEGAARSALPQWLERDAEVEDGGEVSVSVTAPALVPGAPGIPVRAAASLGEGGEAGG
jgi:hypothetical protein